MVSDVSLVQVENVLFRLSRARLESLSPVFRDMFTVPPPTRNDKKGQEGTSDANPIVLEGYKSVDFERLIALVYPRFASDSFEDCLILLLLRVPFSDDFLPGDPVPTYTKEEWTSILKLSTAWEMEKVS
jgi:BTB/POZ domain